MQGAWVQSLVWEDLACRGATKLKGCNYGSLHALEPMLHNERSPCNDKPIHHTVTREQPLLRAIRENTCEQQ